MAHGVTGSGGPPAILMSTRSSSPRPAATASCVGASCVKEALLAKPTTPQRLTGPPATTPRTSPSSRDSRRSASVPACTSARPVCAACTTWSGRSSTTPSTRRSPATATASTSRSTPTTPSPSSTTAAASPWPRWRRRTSRRVEVVLTVLHAGGKFGDGGGYKVSGGLHGVGVSVVNALSEWLDVEVRRDGHVWRRSYERGAPRTPLEKGEATKETGTTITFLPDAEIFETPRLRVGDARAAPARDGLPHPRPADRRSTTSAARARGREFQYEGGIEDFVAPPQREQGPDPAARSCSSRASPTRAPSRSRCSGTPPTRSRSSRSPTTSTRTRAARTCRASARR